MRLLNHIFSFRHFKVRDAYGISSKVPDFPDSHYLLLDFDGLSPQQEIEVQNHLRGRFPSHTLFKESTTHGFHFYVFKPFRFEELIYEMLLTPSVDRAYVAAGLKRGYFFLENREPFQPEYPVQHMRIERTCRTTTEI